MPRYVRGEVVLVPFPFSGEDGYKPRPAIVLASWPYKNSRDYSLCMISTQFDTDPYLMEISTSDLLVGELSRTCYVRPTYNFSADEAFIRHSIGRMRPEKLKAVLYTLFNVLTKETEDD